MKRKHRKDTKRTPGGFIGGNARYKRGKASTKMGKARQSRS